MHLTYLQAAIVGLIQGVTEMFPISSLGHNVLLPALVGGSWAKTLNVSGSKTPYLAYIVGLHVATALALMAYFWRDWIRIIGGFFSSLRHREIETPDQRLAWMIILATIPVGIVGVLFEHEFRILFGTAIYAGIFLLANGLILLAGEMFQRRSPKGRHAQRAQRANDAAIATPSLRVSGAGLTGGPAAATAGGGSAAVAIAAEHIDERDAGIASDRRLARLSNGQAVLIGSAQILALLAGISRDGVVMVTGMFRGLSREDAARFSFLLSAPVILAAGALKLPVLFGPQGKGILGPILLGSVLAAVGAYLSIKFLVSYLRTRTLTPFAIYCLIAGAFSIVYLGIIK
ncbi:MAG: undecaprenyl-diphosphate phosphatase [Streptosporangiaceae bacterium]